MKRNAISLGLICAFVFAIALSAAPGLHERFHRDAKQSQHECVVTLIAAGNYDHAAATPVFVQPAPTIQFSFVSTLNPIWVASPFLGAHIFEHAPPVNS